MDIEKKLEAGGSHSHQNEADDGIHLIPRKRDFFNFYKFTSGIKKDKQTTEMQYFTMRKAKAVYSKKQKTYFVKECRKFHLNKIIRQLTMNEVQFVQ